MSIATHARKILPPACPLLVAWTECAPPVVVMDARDDLKDAHHERYHGERSVDSIVNWAKHFLDQVGAERENTTFRSFSRGVFVSKLTP